MRLLEETGRAAAAAERAAQARESLAHCELCEHHCGVDRLGGELGRCRSGAETRVFSAQVEVSDELELIPTYAIALSGCDMRCSFCITGAQSWNPRAGDPLDLWKLKRGAEDALSDGARTIMILGGEPTVHLHAALQIVSILPESATLIWKTNGHGSIEAQRWLDGMFDLWVVDYKFGNDECAHRLSGTSRYVESVRQNILWAQEHAGLIVRHLIMPGHVECCWEPVADWIAANIPDAKVNLRSGFWPAWRAREHPELRGTVTEGECLRALEIASRHNLHLIE